MTSLISYSIACDVLYVKIDACANSRYQALFFYPPLHRALNEPNPNSIAVAKLYSTLCLVSQAIRFGKSESGGL